MPAGRKIVSEQVPIHLERPPKFVFQEMGYNASREAPRREVEGTEAGIHDQHEARLMLSQAGADAAIIIDGLKAYGAVGRGNDRSFGNIGFAWEF